MSSQHQHKQSWLSRLLTFLAQQGYVIDKGPDPTLGELEEFKEL